MLSAAFVVISIIAIGAGIGYAGYLDIGVPVIIVIIYLRCELKYTILSGVTSLLLVALTLGDIPSAIFMSQSMILGLVCGIIIPREGTIFDDLLFASIFGCIVMIVVDINFSNLTGYSFIKASKEYLSHFLLFTEELKQELYYFLIATVPIGNMFVTYFLSIILGKKFRVLNDSGNRKFLIITKFKNYGSYISCSKNTINTGILSLIIINILGKVQFITSNIYFDIIINSSKYILLFFVLQDCYTLINRFIYSLTKSRLMLLISQLGILYMLSNYFKVTSLVIIIFNFAIDNLLNIRTRQIYILNKSLNEFMKENRKIKVA